MNRALPWMAAAMAVGCSYGVKDTWHWFAGFVLGMAVAFIIVQWRADMRWWVLVVLALLLLLSLGAVWRAPVMQRTDCAGFRCGTGAVRVRLCGGEIVAVEVRR